MLKKLFLIPTIYFLTSANSQAEILAKDIMDYENRSSDSVEYNFSNISPHNKLLLNFDLFIMDSWDGYRPEQGINDRFILQIDGVDYTWVFGANSNNTDSDFIRGDWNGVTTWGDDKDLYFDDFYDGFVFEHSSDTLNITFYDKGLTGGVNNESWRVTDIDVEVVMNYALPISDMSNYTDVPVPWLVSVMPILLFAASRRRKS